MDSYNLLTVAKIEGFADKISGMLWKAYGAPIKFVLVCVLIVVVVLPLAAFIRRILR